MYLKIGTPNQRPASLPNKQHSQQRGMLLSSCYAIKLTHVKFHRLKIENESKNDRKTTNPPSSLPPLPLKSGRGRPFHDLLSSTQSARTQRSASVRRRLTHLNTRGRNSVSLRNTLNQRAILIICLRGRNLLYLFVRNNQKLALPHLVIKIRGRQKHPLYASELDNRPCDQG